MEAEAGERDSRTVTTATDEQRRVRAVAAGRLAVAADPVAGRASAGATVKPSVSSVIDVDEQAAEEAGDGAEDRAAQERDRDAA